MNHVLEILKVLNRSTTHVDLAVILGGIDSKTYEFYTLVEGGYLEDEIRATLYPEGASRSAYYKLKARFEAKLVNALFLIDLSYTSFDKANITYYNIFKVYGAARILIQRNAYRAGVKLLESILSKSIEYEFFSAVILISRDLRRYYSNVGRNLSKSNEYELVLNNALPFYQQELLAESFFLKINHWYISKDQSGYKKFSIEYEAEFENLKLFKNDKVIFNRYLYTGIIYHYELIGDYWMVREVASRGVELFKISKRGRGPLENMFNRKMISELNLRLYDDALYTIYEADTYQVKYSQGWHILKLGHFITLIHMRNYVEARRILIDSSTDRSLEHISMPLKELWQICRAYMILMKNMNWIASDDKIAFRINRFLNNVPVHSKQKRGFNVAILLVHILFLLQQKKYGDVINRVESLRLYSYRYMRKFKKLRSHYFIMMIDALVKGDFRIMRVERYAAPYVKKLKAQPIDMSDMQSTLEIIPYEHMWEMILETLE